MQMKMRKDLADQFCCTVFSLSGRQKALCPHCGRSGRVGTVGRWSGGARTEREPNLLVAACHGCNARFAIAYTSPAEFEPRVVSIHRTV